MFAKNADSSVSVVSERNAHEACEAIDAVWERYKLWSGIALSNLTHLEGSAWRKAMDEGRPFLTNADIKEETIG